MKELPNLKSSRLKRAALFCMLAEMLIALVVLAGWQFDIARFKSPVPGLAAMNPLAALAFLALGFSFLLSLQPSKMQRYSGSAMAIVVIALSTVRFLFFYLRAAPPPDALVFADRLKLDRLALTNSMAFTTTLSFMLSGTAVLLLNRESRRRRLPSHYLALMVMGFALFTVLGYLYGAPEFVSFEKRFPMAVHTAACFLLLSLAVLLAHPDRGVTSEFTATVTGNLLGRWLFFGAFLVPVLLGAARILFISREVASDELAMTLFILAIIVIFYVLIFYLLRQLNRADRLRTRAEKQLRASEEIFRTLVSNIKDYAIYRLDLLGNVITWNRGAESIKGYRSDEIRGQHFSLFYTEEDKQKGVPDYLLKMAREKGEFEMEGWRLRKDGSRFWADVVVTALYDDHNRLTGYAKVTRDITERKKAKDRLNSFNEELKRQVDEKTAELQATASQLRQLAAHLQTAREEERRRIAREIHDELGQMLTGIKMDMVWLRKKVLPAAGDVARRFEEALALLNDAKESMRRIATALHPAVLTDLGLVAALQLLSRDFENRSGISITFTTGFDEDAEPVVSPQVSIALYRIYQETLNNVAKHAQAGNVAASLSKENGSIVLEVRDDGRGFDKQQVRSKKTLGLVSIRERVLMINGTYRIDAAPGRGTALTVSAPLNTMK